MTLRAIRAAALAVLTLSATASCSAGTSTTESSGRRLDDEALPRSGSVELTAYFQDGERWEMTGPLVDAGMVCPDGFTRTIAVRDATSGEALTPGDFVKRVEELASPRDHINVVFVKELRCADGSGSFVMEDNTATGDWTVVSGTGAYSSMDGSAVATSWGSDVHGTPEYLTITLELHLDAAARGRAR